MREAVLGEVADGEGGWPDDAAGIGLVEAAEHLQQRRFSGAVGAAQADTISVADLPGDTIEQRPVAEGFRQFGKLDHGWLSVGNARRTCRLHAVGASASLAGSVRVNGTGQTVLADLSVSASL